MKRTKILLLSPLLVLLGHSAYTTIPWIKSSADEVWLSSQKRETRETTYPPVSIPKRIYMFWDKGWDAAPGTAQLARQSWQLLNPSFEILALNYTEMETLTERKQYIPNHVWRKTKIQAQSDIYRTLLLYKYGGVWVDASLVAAIPLTDWLDFSSTDLISFVRTDNEGRAEKMRITPWITSWFLAAPKESHIISGIFDVITNSTEMYRFTKEYFWWHRIVSELAIRDKRVADVIWHFRSGDPMHCKTGKYHLDAPVFKRCANKKMVHIVETTRRCCGMNITSDPTAPNVSSLCEVWSCDHLGRNFRLLPKMKSVYGDSKQALKSFKYKESITRM